MDAAIAFFRREQILEEEKKRLRGSVETCSIHGAVAGSETFTLRFADYETYNKWQDKMLSLSDPPTGATLEYQDRIVTLTTCTENSSVRMTVQGKLIWKTS